MTGYCKHCEQAHSAWTRLNDCLICGHCGTRVRNLHITPVNVNKNRPAVKRQLTGRSNY